jgi:hypothetical protein
MLDIAQELSVRCRNDQPPFHRSLMPIRARLELRNERATFVTIDVSAGKIHRADAAKLRMWTIGRTGVIEDSIEDVLAMFSRRQSIVND